MVGQQTMQGGLRSLPYNAAEWVELAVITNLKYGAVNPHAFHSVSLMLREFQAQGRQQTAPNKFRKFRCLSTCDMFFLGLSRFA